MTLQITITNNLSQPLEGVLIIVTATGQEMSAYTDETGVAAFQVNVNTLTYATLACYLDNYSELNTIIPVPTSSASYTYSISPQYNTTYNLKVTDMSGTPIVASLVYADGNYVGYTNSGGNITFTYAPSPFTLDVAAQWYTPYSATVQSNKYPSTIALASSIAENVITLIGLPGVGITLSGGELSDQFVANYAGAAESNIFVPAGTYTITMSLANYSTTSFQLTTVPNIYTYFLPIMTLSSDLLTGSTLPQDTSITFYNS